MMILSILLPFILVLFPVPHSFQAKVDGWLYLAQEKHFKAVKQLMPSY